jgi:hypothetical protein
MFIQNLTNSPKKLPLLFNLGLAAFCALSVPTSIAQTVPQPSTAPLELSLLIHPSDSVVTANTINPKTLTIPSLWYAKANTEKKLLSNWLAYPPTDKQPGRVDLLVNQQIWNSLDYLERYKFVNRLGSITRSFNYNMRVFDYQQEFLAAYTCSFTVKPSLCNIQMSNRNGLNLSR